MTTKVTLAAYYYPGFHQTPETDFIPYPRWTEWDMLKQAKRHYEGHYQPRVPLWGYEDEVDPTVMARKIDTAAQHGISVFHVVWYWYRNKPFLHEALERGYLNAPNRSRIRFSIMWANHDRYDGFPEPCSGPTRLLCASDYSEEAIKTMFAYWVDNYFSSPSYWRLGDDRLFVTILQPSEMICRAGGEERCRSMLANLRRYVRSAGLGEIHLNTAEGHFFPELWKLRQLGFDSVTNYCTLGYRESKDNPDFSKIGLPDYAGLRRVSYAGRLPNVTRTWNYVHNSSGLPYFPVVTVGRDCTPRVAGPAEDGHIGRYGNRPVLDEATPSNFRTELTEAVRLAPSLSRPHLPLVFINSWNEWTEGSYLEPDTRYGYQHLAVVREFASSIAR